MWQGLEQGTEQQRAFVKTIKNIYFATKLESQPPRQQHWSDIDKDLELA